MQFFLVAIFTIVFIMTAGWWLAYIRAETFKRKKGRKSVERIKTRLVHDSRNEKDHYDTL